jgi:hypothetical protein
MLPGREVSLRNATDLKCSRFEINEDYASRPSDVVVTKGK